MRVTTALKRADARNNRDQIIAATLIAFREQGVDVPMKEIADRAGVGVGTLYRHFPDRDALIAETAQSYLADLAGLAATAWREEGAAWAALSRFLHACAERRVGALAAAIEPNLHAEIRADPRLREVRAAIVELVERMTRAAQADGAMRADVEPGDVARLMTLQVYTRPDESYVDAVHRVVEIVLAGLRAG
ncbi:TetR/AcrR family transcriptional regulator [Nocardia sp. NBC_00565]|uniref:TetR/AcrR family transcriptional regulator n=1 Tax=Nocardia sp. NBC_00565 TaxID=2975993 RepID=UPI002E82400E|nr:TetR family transcriptional regulator [Nocardia sp. NBC_00565]WUC01329.1 TetR/AcrR family transcriptional regulator [Nocardia sp. NBC_00565]